MLPAFVCGETDARQEYDNFGFALTYDVKFQYQRYVLQNGLTKTSLFAAFVSPLLHQRGLNTLGADSLLLTLHFVSKVKG